MAGAWRADGWSMSTPQSTLRDLYPDATVDQVLRGHMPPRLGVSARTWSRLVWGIVSIVLGTLVMVWLLEKVAGPEAVNAWFGGTGQVTYDHDGDPRTLDRTWLPTLLYTLSAIAAITYGLLRVALKPPWRRERRIPWEQWAGERGFAPAGKGMPRMQAGTPVVTGGRQREWTGPWRGRAGDHTVHVGATAWTTGSGRSTERHHAFFAIAELSPQAAVAFPASSVTHFLRGFSDFSIEVGGRELRSESIDVDLNCEIRVESGDDVRWRQLFDPPMVHALAEQLDVQWHQRGNRIMFVSGGRWHSRAPVETLDTMCAGVEYVVRRFEFAARMVSASQRAA